MSATKRMTIGITGGIGSGKSHICKILATHGISVYDCDSAAKRLMRSSPEIQSALTRLIGPDTYTGGALNKTKVAEFLLSSEENAHAIDAIVHPAVARDFRLSGAKWMECAILFESGFSRLVDKTVVVTAPEAIRLQRVMARDGISEDKAREWMARQWPQEELVRRADHEIINDGAHDEESQLIELINKLK